jgi:hypothetical protein
MDEPLRLPPDRPSDDRVLCHAGGSIDSCSVSLRVFGENLDPDSVSGILGAVPTAACRRGDVTRSKVYDRVEKQGKWLLTVDRIRGVLLDALINQLLDRLTDDLAGWRELTDQYKVDLFCGLQMELWNRGLGLSPRTLLRVGERGLELGLDIYYVGESEEEAAPSSAFSAGTPEITPS